MKTQSTADLGRRSARRSDGFVMPCAFGQTTELPVAQIKPGDNDRKTFDENALRELADSIKANGLVQPIIVRPIARPNGHRYEIVAGERRFRAVRDFLKAPTITAIVRNLSDEKASENMLVENTGREDLNVIEEGQAYETRAVTFGWDNARIAKVSGKSIELVAARRSLLQLTPELQQLAANGNLQVGFAEALTRLDHNRQRIAAGILSSGGNNGTLSLRTFRNIIDTLLREQNQDQLFEIENYWQRQVAKKANLPRKGKMAFTGAPTRSDLPTPIIRPRDNAAQILERYIKALLDGNFNAEAGVIGNVYDAMIRTNYMAVPEMSVLTDDPAPA